RRTCNPDPRKTKPHAHKNVGFVSSLGPASAGLFFCRSMPAETRGASPARVGALRLNRQTAIDDVRPLAAERAQARGAEFRMIRGQPASAEPG
ncbi:hypothetical protein, partial [Burkholderia pseudomallei]|uniref:hypothetical protein n=1 Tax=Burkholderia pseudomallei TaxID=28450 RepID=UPI001C4D7BCA